MQPLKANRLPLSLQAQQYLLSLIQDGTYEAGEQLPSEADLANRLGISRSTLREALLNLEQEGIVVRKHGVGTFVAPDYELRLESGLERLESILTSAARKGLHLQFDALQIQEEPVGAELADKLQVAPGTLVTGVQRVLVTKKRPVAYMFDVASSTILSPEDLDETFNGSVLDLLREKGERQIAQAIANIVALNADAFLVEKLSVEPGRAVLLLEETLFDQAGEVVEFSRNYFVPEFFHFYIVRR